MNARPRNQKPADFFLTGGGTVYLLHPLTQQAEAWLADHCPCDGEHQYLGNALAVEHRFVSSLVAQAQLDGLKPLQQQGEGRMR
jgi:hypothetical protein